MPLREYLCKKCGHRFEKIQKFSDKLIKKCPDCGGPVEETISAPAVRFKGSGFYVTDYPKKSNAAASSSSGKESGYESSGKSGSEGSSKSGSESSSKSNSEGSSKSSNEGSSSEGSKETKKQDKPKAESSDKKSKKD